VFAAAKRLGENAADCGTYKEWATSHKAEKIRDGLRCGLPANCTRTLVVVDQLEELLTLAPPDHRQAYVQHLLDLAAPNDESFAIVLTMRRDYYNLCSEFPPLYDRLEADNRRARYLLERMRDEDLHRVVTEPLKLAGVAASEREALARSVHIDVGERPGDLALVQFALTATWQHRNEYGGDLLQSYTGIGRVEGALARAAENVYADPDILGGDANEAEIGAVFIRLVRLGDTGGATRRIVRRPGECRRWSTALAEALSGRRRGSGCGHCSLGILLRCWQWPDREEMHDKHWRYGRVRRLQRRTHSTGKLDTSICWFSDWLWRNAIKDSMQET
jgi:hypothetical protein